MKSKKEKTYFLNALACLVCGVFTTFMGVASETNQAVSAFTTASIILFLVAGICFTASPGSKQLSSS